YFFIGNKFCLISFKIIFRMIDVFGGRKNNILLKIGRIIYFFGLFGFDIKIVVSSPCVPDNRFFGFTVKPNRIGFYYLTSLLKNRSLCQISQRVFNSSCINFFFLVIINDDTGSEFIILVFKLCFII